jgi:hypothetical protein
MEAEMSDGGVMQVVWPAPAVLSQDGAMAARLRSLEGARIGFLDNTKVNLDILFGEIGAVLEHQYRVADTERVRKPSMAGPMTAANREHLRQFDAIVTAMGD